MAGLAAMLLAGIIGTAMGLNNTGTFMASGVAFVAVSLWVDSRISRRRSAARKPAAAAGKDTAAAGNDPGLALDADVSKREG
ncbi:hypothetical protein SAMN04487915_104248 [Arthrobacter sp. ov118]|nr:hypothetical protein SAMN04487915_104248 [Arthrobacter sp. ov118]